jgi:resuscitation-promoting factor RpfA
VVCVVAIYVGLFGVGSETWSIMVLGVGLLLMATVLAVIAATRGRAPVWVAGVAYVVSVSAPPVASSYGRCELQVLVDAPGLSKTAVKVRDSRVPVAKWPASGDTVPVRVAVSDPRRLRIQWDDIPTHAERAGAFWDDELATDDSGR